MTVYGGSKVATLVVKGERKAINIQNKNRFRFDDRRIGKTGLKNKIFFVARGHRKPP